ncbi:RHS repeat-associated core domain-containing protein [Treponema sp. C6A8]|uniref:RHS repeat-associated core domain-containing protein n=1 Tax=Treponema sp. C6A8 TaxID=1410609 RepID=UPI000487BCBE|nr:RHS repeat-associated core domain-containing protein [Treponema sp. C6A8]
MNDYSAANDSRGGTDFSYDNASVSQAQNFKTSDSYSAVPHADGQISSININIAGKPALSLYNDSSADAFCYDFRGSLKSVFGDNSNCKSVNCYDTWGSPYSSGNQLSFSNAAGIINTDILFYNLAQRDYAPALKTFITMDSARDGLNWFSYCACDPVNYYDKSGQEKLSFSEEENLNYAIAIMDTLARFNRDEYLEAGEDYFIPSTYNCAEVSFAVDRIGAKIAGMENYSELATVFDTKFSEGNISGAANSVWSGDFYENTSGAVRNTSSGYDRDCLRNMEAYKAANGSYENEEAHDSLVAMKNDAIKALSNPDNVSVGTVLAWQKSENPCPDNASKNWKGHTITVIARSFDASGNITGFAYIEGHYGGNATRIGYMNVGGSKIADYDGGITTIDSIYGNYVGTFEIESSNAIKSGGCAK